MIECYRSLVAFLVMTVVAFSAQTLLAQDLGERAYLKSVSYSPRLAEPGAQHRRDDLAGYSFFLLDPVEFSDHGQRSTSDLSEQDRHEFLRYVQDAFQQSLMERYTPSIQPSPRAIRVKILLTDVHDNYRRWSRSENGKARGADAIIADDDRGECGTVSYGVTVFDAASNVKIRSFEDTRSYPCISPDPLAGPRYAFKEAARELSGTIP